MKKLYFLLITFVLSCSTSPLNNKDELLSRGRDFTQHLFNGDVDYLWNQMSLKMKDAFKSKENFIQIKNSIFSKIGKEVKLESEHSYPASINYSTYYRKSFYENTKDALLVMQWSFDRDGNVAGFSIRGNQKPAESKFLYYKVKNQYFFPLKRDAYIIWGGREIEANYHSYVPNQRFAYDIIVAKGNRSYRGEGQKNEDYFCFGQPVFAPGEGTVIEAVDGVQDNQLGVMNREQLMGNHIIIDHGQGEYSFLAHLKVGSVKTRKGDRVDHDTQIGECGNSGNSSEPHVHYHLQNHQDFKSGQGLPLQFKDIVVDGKVHPLYEPVINQRIERVQ